MNKEATDMCNDTTGRVENWVRNSFEVPAWADEISKEADGDLPSAAYAWPETRMFPVATKADTWWSSVTAGRALMTADIPASAREKVASNLKKACNFWGIYDTDFVHLDEPEAEKEAGLQFNVELRNGDDILDTITVFNEDQFVKTAEWLTSTGRRNLPFRTRRDAARDMLNCEYASGLSTEQRIELEKTACFGAVSRQSLTCMLDNLSRGLDKLGYAEFKGLLDPAIRDCPEITAGTELDKTAETIDGVHRALRVMKKAEGVNMAPLEETLNIQTPTMLEKAGESFIVLPDGRFIDDEEFDKHAEVILEYVNTVLQKEATADNLRDVVEGLNDTESAEFTEAVAALGL